MCVLNLETNSILFLTRLKLKCLTFGGNAPKQFTLAVGAKHLSWCTKMKYLGCIFLAGSCEIEMLGNSMHSSTI